MCTAETLVAETLCCLLGPLFLFIWRTQATSEACPSGDGGAAVRTLQEEYMDCPVDYNLSFEYHTALHSHKNNFDGGAKGDG